MGIFYNDFPRPPHELLSLKTLSVTVSGTLISFFSFPLPLRCCLHPKLFFCYALFPSSRRAVFTDLFVALGMTFAVDWALRTN